MWATGATIAAGALRRQLAAPAVGSERVFVCIVAGTTHATTEPTWVITRGGKTTDNTVTWQECTGIAALNGDATNTPSWTITATPPGGVKGTAVTLGQVIKRDSGASYQICTTAGTAGSGAEPSFSNTAGTTTADGGSLVWTSLGAVGNFTIWNAPHARITNAQATNWGNSNSVNTFFVSASHAETQAAAIAFTSSGSVMRPFQVLCVSQTPGSTPPGSGDFTTGATVATTGNFNIQFQQYAYYDGISFTAGSGAVAAVFSFGVNAYSHIRFKNCAFIRGGTSAGSPPIYDTQVDFINTTLQFGNTADSISLAQAASLLWENTASAIAGATLPTTLFKASFPNGTAIIRGVDLSALGAGKTLVAVQASGGADQFQFIDCKLGASVTVASAPTVRRVSYVEVISSDSGATNYRQERYLYEGTLTAETTIVRTSGATDGTTPIAWKIVTTANSTWLWPFETFLNTIWNDTTGSSITVTVYGIWGGGAVPNNDDIWLDAEYLGSSSTPLGSFATATKANVLATGSALTSDSSTWGGSTTAFKMSVSFTPQMKGPIKLWVRAAKLSTTFYIDPEPEISGVTVSKSEILAPGVYANELSSGGGSSSMQYRNDMRGNLG